jgi:hypothetical protein
MQRCVLRIESRLVEEKIPHLTILESLLLFS